MNKDAELLNFIYNIKNERLVGITEHSPLCCQIIDKIQKINIDDNASVNEIFRHEKDIHNIWISLIEKSIECLRYYDKREPFLNNKKKQPLAYGIEKLNSYYIKYSEFESVLYGGSQYYRDHVIHVFRVWMLGIKVLLGNDYSCQYLHNIKINDEANINDDEKISIWTMVALMHDLGYPLEKASEIY